MSNNVDNEATTILELSPATLRDSASAGFGVTVAGFSAKPFARVLAEKLLLARNLMGDSVDLGSGSPIRKLIEVTALEDARMWAALAATYDDMHIASARDLALSRLGEELGLPRPNQCATGYLTLKLTGTLPAPTTSLTIPRGARMLTSGGHHVALAEAVVLSATSKQRRVAVEAFYPGPEHNLDPSIAVGSDFPQKIDRWHRADTKLAELNDTEQRAGKVLIEIDHTEALTGGELLWPDLRYRQLLLRAPRSIWTLAAVEMAVAMVPGVRQVLIQDRYGGLDLKQSIFGNFNFIERMFSTGRDLGSPYYFSVLVAPTAAAIWNGPDGLRAAIEQALEDVRPIGIYPTLTEATEIGVGVAAKLVVKGLPLPSGTSATVNGSIAAQQLRTRLHARLQRYIDGLQFGEPVRVSEVIWTLMSEPGIADARDVRLVRFPTEPHYSPEGESSTSINKPALQELDIGLNLELAADQAPVYIELESPPRLEII